MTTKTDIREWLEQAIKGGYSHVMIVCDTFSYEDYPVYLRDKKTFPEDFKRYSQNMQKVMEVYDLSQDLEQQLNQPRCWSI